MKGFTKFWFVREGICLQLKTRAHSLLTFVANWLMLFCVYREIASDLQNEQRPTRLSNGKEVTYHG
ncbi:MAG: hypothetical protein ACK4I8_03625 [Armatimonadota bacterium]